MQTKEITKTIYIADDSREFLYEEDCKEYEKTVLNILKNVKYFKVYCSPDLSETGNYQEVFYVAVYSKINCYHYNILLKWLVIEEGYSIIRSGVMGYDYMPDFRIEETDREHYEYMISSKKSTKFLSNEKIDFYPPNIDYMKIWNLK